MNFLKWPGGVVDPNLNPGTLKTKLKKKKFKELQDFSNSLFTFPPQLIRKTVEKKKEKDRGDPVTYIYNTNINILSLKYFLTRDILTFLTVSLDENQTSFFFFIYWKMFFVLSIFLDLHLIFKFCIE